MSYKTQKKQHEKWVDNIEIVYAVVAGSDDFPFDMLRFDCCYPQAINDSEQLESEQYEYRVVLLARDRGGAFCEDRWKSFTWKVVGQSTDRLAMEKLKNSCIAQLNQKKEE